MKTPTLPAIQQLYASTRAASSRFAGYNFHAYFLRRTDETFAPALAALGDTSTIQLPAHSYAAGKKLPDAELPAWYARVEGELAVIQRSGEINAMYGAEKLVVENEPRSYDGK